MAFYSDVSTGQVIHSCSEEGCFLVVNCVHKIVGVKIEAETLKPNQFRVYVDGEDCLFELKKIKPVVAPANLSREEDSDDEDEALDVSDGEAEASDDEEEPEYIYNVEYTGDWWVAVVGVAGRYARGTAQVTLAVPCPEGFTWMFILPNTAKYPKFGWTVDGVPYNTTNMIIKFLGNHLLGPSPCAGYFVRIGPAHYEHFSDTVAEAQRYSNIRVLKCTDTLFKAVIVWSWAALWCYPDRDIYIGGNGVYMKMTHELRVELLEYGFFDYVEVTYFAWEHFNGIRMGGQLYNSDDPVGCAMLRPQTVPLLVLNRTAAEKMAVDVLHNNVFHLSRAEAIALNEARYLSTRNSRQEFATDFFIMISWGVMSVDYRVVFCDRPTEIRERTIYIEGEPSLLEIYYLLVKCKFTEKFTVKIYFTIGEAAVGYIFSPLDILNVSEFVEMPLALIAPFPKSAHSVVQKSKEHMTVLRGEESPVLATQMNNVFKHLRWLKVAVKLAINEILVDVIDGNVPRSGHQALHTIDCKWNSLDVRYYQYIKTENYTVDVT